MTQHGDPRRPAAPGSRPGGLVLPAATHAYLTRSATSLREALLAPDATTRYACAHVAALRAAAALLAARSVPAPAARRRSRNAWVLLKEAAPDLADWAAFFASGAGTYAAAQAGSTRATTHEEADELVGEADRFLAVVEAELGLIPHAWSEIADGVVPGEGGAGVA
ncbi:MAG TPA: SAV_6107 family HEPN domain-containing protein [Nocardioides sp.]